MAQAGYDPHEAIAFWERMSGCPRNMIGKLCFRSGAGVPEFLSTHPSEETRIKNIEHWIPEAMHYYHPSSASPLRGCPLLFSCNGPWERDGVRDAPPATLMFN
jgi:predicted Zn-dependent protease